MGGGLHVAGGGPGRLCEEKHAVQLGGHVDGQSLHGVAQHGVGHGGQGEAEQLVVAVDAGALGHAILVVGVDGLLVAALDVGEGVLVGAGKALERRGLGHVVGGEDVFGAAHCGQWSAWRRAWRRARRARRARAGGVPSKSVGLVGGALVILVHGHHGHGELLVGPWCGLEGHWGWQVRHGDGVEALHGDAAAGTGPRSRGLAGTTGACARQERDARCPQQGRRGGRRAVGRGGGVGQRLARPGRAGRAGLVLGATGGRGQPLQSGGEAGEARAAASKQQASNKHATSNNAVSVANAGCGASAAR